MKRYISIIFMLCINLGATTTNYLTQWNIGWYFDNEVEYGTFANGDFWVLAPVTITNMTPAWDGANNGWEINPLVQNAHGLSALVSGYIEAMRPALPLTLTSNCSLVKVVGRIPPTTANFVSTAAVLTVLSSPLDSTNYFRPPYVGTNKPLYQISDLRTNLLPSYASVSNSVTLASVISDFSKCLRLDHHASLPRRFRPSSAMGDYQPENTDNLNNAMLRLMLDDPYEDIEPALILFTQHALDQAYAVYCGYRAADDGHNPNHRVVAAWGATMFGITDIITYMATADEFHEDNFIVVGNGRSLWGDSRGGEAYVETVYWNYLIGLGSAKSTSDPYGYIDGGKLSSVGAAYQNVTSQSLKGQALIFTLFPSLTNCMPNERYTNLVSYAERWVTNGAWASPDPVAPIIAKNVTGITVGSPTTITSVGHGMTNGVSVILINFTDTNTTNGVSDTATINRMTFVIQNVSDNTFEILLDTTGLAIGVGTTTAAEPWYEVLYGPDPANPGSAIAGSGRFPLYHAVNKDGGQYKSEFVAAMWDAYATSEDEPLSGPAVTILTPSDDQYFLTNTIITLTCTPQNGNGTITNIGWYINSELFVNSTNSSLTTNAGAFEIETIATDDNGMTGGGSVNITVTNSARVNPPISRRLRFVPTTP